MGAAAAEADRTLFVGNLDPKVTEELLFELFHQAGPVIKVKIPKDRDGKPKQFAFVNFKHEESVPYGMDLLNGIKLFGRPLKIQFRSGSSHASQDNNSPYSQPGYANGSPSSIQQLPTTTASSSRYERNVDNISTESPTVQRSFSSPDNLQRQAVMNNMWQQSQYSGRHNSLHPEPSGFASPGHHPSYSFTQSSASSMQWRSETSAAQRKNRVRARHPVMFLGRRTIPLKQRVCCQCLVCSKWGSLSFTSRQNLKDCNPNHVNAEVSSIELNRVSSQVSGIRMAASGF
uniref:RNA-binding protein 7 n=1 Tax=Podarcis muralis TaxID=64176 RepID=A0A670JU27_PODMU